MSGKHLEPGEHNPAPRQQAPLSVTVNRVRGETRTPLWADFRYDPDDPLFVTVVFRPRNEPAVTWQIGRDLLRDGLLQPSGIGDVRIWPATYRGRAVVRVRLREHRATALFEVSLPELQAWLMRTCALVPPGEELGDVDWDTAVRDLGDGP